MTMPESLMDANESGKLYSMNATWFATMYANVWFEIIKSTLCFDLRVNIDLLSKGCVISIKVLKRNINEIYFHFEILHLLSGVILSRWGHPDKLLWWLYNPVMWPCPEHCEIGHFAPSNIEYSFLFIHLHIYRYS